MTSEAKQLRTTYPLTQSRTQECSGLHRAPSDDRVCVCVCVCKKSREREALFRSTEGTTSGTGTALRRALPTLGQGGFPLALASYSRCEQPFGAKPIWNVSA